MSSMNPKLLVITLVFLILGLFVSASYAINTVTGVSAPATALQGTSVTITVMGDDADDHSICGSSISYGDGGSDSKLPQPLPHVYTHTYIAPTVGMQIITASAAGGICSGTARATITIISVRRARTPALSTIGETPVMVTGVIAPRTVSVNQPFTIKVQGRGGVCPEIHISWSRDASPYQIIRNYNLSAPRAISHTYRSPGRKLINVFGRGEGCSRSAGKWVRVPLARIAPPGKLPTLRRPRIPKVEGITGAASGVIATPYRIKVTGYGRCAWVRIAWGDGKSTDVYNYNLSRQTDITHIYSRQGRRIILAVGRTRSRIACIGSASKRVTIGR